jgi:hypothetical protein
MTTFLYIVVCQTVIHGPPVVPGDLQTISEEKAVQKLYQTQRIKNSLIHICAKTAFDLLVGLQQKAGLCCALH